MKRIKKNSCITILGRDYFDNRAGHSYQNSRIYVDNDYLMTTVIEGQHDEGYVAQALELLLENGYLKESMNCNRSRLSDKYGYKFLCHCEDVKRYSHLYQIESD